jgi:hypothetical protein
MVHRWAHSRRRVWGKREMMVVREDNFPRCTEELLGSFHRERRLSPRNRLRKISFCSSLNSQKEPIPTQSPLSAARKILLGRARACASAGP